tara:strand:+ start:1386 stop:1994 length:609 start_codon:yes stop_codon:yes gene_type:complete
MPGIKSTIYDGAIHVSGDAIDLRGPSTKVGCLVNGAVSAGQTSIITDGTDSAGFDVGDKLVSGLTGRAVGIVKTAATNLITLEKGSLTSMVDNDSIELAPKFEIVGIMPIGKTSGGVNVSTALLDKLIPVNRNWFGTVAPNDATWTAHDDMVTRFGAADEGSSAVSSALQMASGVLLEGRWKMIDVTEAFIIYLKAAPTQTF